MPALVVPGVRVEARFDVLPPLPAPSGIVGAVGVVDRPPPEGGLVSVTKVTELRQVLGQGTEVSMSEAVHALSNGASEAVISPVAGGAPAALALLNAKSNEAVRLICRSNGAWGNRLAATVRELKGADNKVRRVTIRLLLDGVVKEEFADLLFAPGQPDDLFDTINRRSRHVVAVDPGFAGKQPKADTYPFLDTESTVNVPIKEGGKDLFQLAPGEGVDPIGLSVKIETTANKITVKIFQSGLQETFTDLVMDPDSDQHLPYVLLTQSRFVRVQPLSSIAIEEDRLPAAVDAPAAFADGASPKVQDYQTAIDLLADDTRIDLVFASIDSGLNASQARQIHQSLLAHAVSMADAGAPRIAFGSIHSDEQPTKKKPSLQGIRDHAATVRNRRFVLVAPNGAEGAVAGMVGRMNPQDSPTFKNVPLFGLDPAAFRESELNQLLGSNFNTLVVQDRAGRGVVVLKGIDTTGDQISVTRVADQCIRETKAISENFIGRLNSDEARVALRQQLIATFTRLERDGALVRSTDGEDPAFLLDVYSTQQDFAQGIVRIDIAVRPVRAIDYIYATIRVKN